jgi:hypothetical protein
MTEDYITSLENELWYAYETMFNAAFPERQYGLKIAADKFLKETMPAILDDRKEKARLAISGDN